MRAELLVTSFALSSLGAWAMTRLAVALSLLDFPTERSSHCQPTPKGGGVGILAAFYLVGVVSDVTPWFWGAIGFLSILAGYGDRRELTLRLRLFGQFGLIAVFVIGARQTSYGYLFSLSLILFWIIFIAGTANMYNFMDGINGIAGISGVVGFSLLAYYILYHEGQSSLSTLSLCMAFSCVGFLPSNMPVAKVFMGDIGSILLGAVFAGIIYLTSHNLMDFVCMASFLFPFYADVLCTMVIRLKDGENLTLAHRRHVYQILANEHKIAHWLVSLGYGFVQTLIGISVLMVRPFGMIAVLTVLICSLVFFITGGYFVRAGLGRIF